MTDDIEQTARDTVDLLEQRLRRIEYFLTGHDPAQESLQEAVAEGKDRTVLTRLAKVENSLAKLASSSPVVEDLLKLYRSHLDLFQPANIAEVPTSLTTPELLAIISSCATSYPTTASRLTAIKASPIPSAESSASMIALHPRLAQVELRQDSQGREIAELRLRSASMIRRWYELGVLAGSECWSEWEARLNTVESRVRRGETQKALEAKANKAYGS